MAIFDYAPAPESVRPQIRDDYGLFIDGRWTPPESGLSFETVNPATETVLARVAQADAADVDRAVRAARKGYDKYWRKLKPADRAKYIYRIARAITERSRELAVLETMDGGKPIKESRDFDIPLAAAHFFYNAGWADKLEWVMRAGREPQPLGVCGQIVPWNFPLLMAAWKIAPALACGNTVVLKPAETTPLTALALAQIIEEADLPPGVVNVITGDGTTGAALVEHPDVDKIAFTGSTEVGKIIARRLAGSDKRLTLELGGKAAHIVFADAPMDQAIEGVVNGIYFNQGHVCCAGSRLLVEERVHDEIVVRLTERLQTLRLGDPLDKNTDIGAINSRAQLEKIEELVRSGVEQGATLVQQQCDLPSRGFFFPASFFSNVHQSHRIAREEIFGPVMSIIPFKTADEVVDRANRTTYGLAAAVWTRDIKKAHAIANSVRAGTVWVNCYNVLDTRAPFGGFKQSGIGRELGEYGLQQYTEVKTVTVKL